MKKFFNKGYCKKIKILLQYKVQLEKEGVKNMKTLLKSMVAAVAVAFGASSAYATESGVVSSVNFDNLLTEEVTSLEYKANLGDSQNIDLGETSMWRDATGAVYTTEAIIGTVKPHSPVIDGNANFLELDTDATVLRAIDSTAHQMGSIFIDTLVKFTPSDEDATATVNAGDKIVIWMQEVNIDAEDPPATNLVITCGDGSGNQVDYIVNGLNDKKWESEKWYRLVVKSGSALAEGDYPAFLVYLSEYTTNDATLQKVTGTRTVVTTEPATEEGGEDTTTTEVISTDVFPSLDRTSGQSQTITYLGVNGMGGIDELTFTTVDPCPDVKYFNLTWDSNIASLSYVIGDGTSVALTAEELALGSKTIELPATGGTIALTYTANDGYTASGAVVRDCTVEGNVITVEDTALAPAYAITTKANNFYVGDTPYETFEEAFANLSSGGTIKLGRDVVIPRVVEGTTPQYYFGSIYIYDGMEVTIDLNGKALRGNYTEADDTLYTIWNCGGSLTIIDSSVEGTGSIWGSQVGIDENGDPVYYGDALCVDGGSTFIQAGLFEAQVIYNSGGVDNFDALIEITGGSFKYNGGISEGSTFNLDQYVADGYTATSDGEYINVTESTGGGEEITYVASIGENKYETFAEAFNAAAAEDTIMLLANIEITEKLTVSKNLTIDLGGFTITETVPSVDGEFDYGAFYVRPSVTFTIADSVGGGQIISDDGVVIGNYGTVIVNAGAIGSGSDVDNDTSIYNFYYNGSTYGNTTVSGGTVASIWNCGTVSLTDGTVEYIDNSGALTVSGTATVTSILAQNGSDAADVENAGTITGPSGLNITAEEGYEVNYDSETGKYTLVIKLTLTGEGTAESPYLITNLADLQNFRDYVNDGNSCAGVYFKVTAAEIDLSAETPWTPIAKTNSNGFCGVFDGNNVVIKNMALENGDGCEGAFFWLVSGNAQILNITFSGADILITHSNAKDYAVAVLTAQNGTGIVISNIVNNVNVTGTARRLAAICSMVNTGNCTIIDCVNNGNLAGRAALNNTRGTAGITAILNTSTNTDPATRTDIKFIRCTNNGAISGGCGNAGILAYIQQARSQAYITFDTCINNGNVTAAGTIADHDVAGGIIGRTGSGKEVQSNYILKDCQNRGNLVSVDVLGNLIGSWQAGTRNPVVLGKTVVRTQYPMVDQDYNAEGNYSDAEFQGEKFWIWNAKIAGETYTTLYSDLADAVADANGAGTIEIAADATLKNSFALEEALTIAGGTISGGALRIASGTLNITGGTFTLETLAVAEDAAEGTTIAITGGTFNVDPTAYVAEDYTATEADGIWTVAAAGGATEWEDTVIVDTTIVSGGSELTAEALATAKTNLDTLGTELAATAGGEATAVQAWIARVYGSEGKLPAAKLAATTAALIALAVDFDLPILGEEPTVEIESAAPSAGGAAAFEFTLKDGTDPIAIQAAAEKVKQAIKYSSAVNGTYKYNATKFTVTITNGKLKAEFVAGDNCGFGKVKFEKDAE